MERFVRLFEEYGYKVETFGKSYIAYNDTFCIPFTNVGTEDYPMISAVSFLSKDKENIKKKYEGEELIGCEVFSDWATNRLEFTHIGGICNHDHNIHEVESWLRNKNNYFIHKTGR